MKKLLSLLLALVIILGSIPTFGEDNFLVQHGSIEVDEEKLNIKVVYPFFEGFNGSEKLNMEIQNLISNSIGEARSSSNYIKLMENEAIEGGEGPFGPSSVVTLDINYDYMKNGDISSVQLNSYLYSGGAHGIYWINSFTLNTKTGEFYEIKDLFKDESQGIDLVTKLVLDYIDKYPDEYFDNARDIVQSKNGDYEFYIDGDKIVIFFGLYDIDAYAGGIKRMPLELKWVESLLKDEVSNSIKDGEERGVLSLNGMNINSQAELYNGEIILLPLRAIAEVLGYEVGWSQEDGAIVAGGTIKNGVNSYFTTGKEPISLIPPVVESGITYVPIQYFTEVLEENISLGSLDDDKIIIRAYSKLNFENNFYNLIKELEMHTTKEDAVNAYAEAVKMRNGAVQYGLLSDNLREEKYYELKDLAFVTGTSSPWVDSYKIAKIKDYLYQIEFTLKTSVPNDELISVINMELEEYGQYWRINSIEEVNR
ncbi:MAG: DUF3298 domain-containing protein [Tissierella sp.]|nr:DUF3298 domain-containing protein [Tissierella sp.]